MLCISYLSAARYSGKWLFLRDSVTFLKERKHENRKRWGKSWGRDETFIWPASFDHPVSNHSLLHLESFTSYSVLTLYISWYLWYTSGFQILLGKHTMNYIINTLTQHIKVHTTRSLVKLSSSLYLIHLARVCLKIFEKENYSLESIF